MRKQYKVKKRACGMCKPHKKGWAKRWSVQAMREVARAMSDEQEARDAEPSLGIIPSMVRVHTMQIADGHQSALPVGSAIRVDLSKEQRFTIYARVPYDPAS